MKSAGFKEWAIVCEALGRGEQSVIVRKGGIAEGREGFSFREREFFLFPTFFHEQLASTRSRETKLPEQLEDAIAIRYYAEVERTKVITEWDEAEAMRPFHVLREEVIRQRFEYDDAPGLHVAFVRVFRLRAPWIIADSKKYRGCRSWVSLPETAERIAMEPVLAADVHLAKVKKFDETILTRAGELRAIRKCG